MGSTIEYATGAGLFESGPVRVVVDGYTERYAPTLDYAVAWKQAAEAVGFRVFVYYDENSTRRLNV
jgi:hypothetical protein